MSWKNFSTEELQCSCCGASNPNPEFIVLMDKIQILRTQAGFPFPVNSAYRCKDHPLEAKKERPGMHPVAAIDIAINRARAHTLLRLAMALGFRGIGVNQKGKTRFIHLDLREVLAIWSY